MDAAMQKSLEQMRSFILQEATEKVREIESKAKEEFFIEKNHLVEEEKNKIRQEYDRKNSQIAVKRRIQMSNKSNAVLLDAQKQRNDLLEGLLEKAKVEVSERMKDAAWHKALLVNLISQGLKELFEEKVEVICRQEDVELVKSAIPEAIEKAKAGSQNPINFKVILSESEHLPPSPHADNAGPSCIGGVILTCKAGKIRLNNTAEARLHLAYQKSLPRMKQILFPDKLQTIF